MPNLLTRQPMERVNQAGWIYVVHDGKDYRVKIQDLLALVTKETLGLDQVDNTSDEQKPLSIALRDALRAKVDASALGDLVNKGEFSNAIQELSVRIQGLFDRLNQQPTPPTEPEQPQQPPASSLTLEQVTEAITAFWNTQKAEGGEFRGVQTKVTEVETKAGQLETKLQELTTEVGNIPRVNNAATQEDLSALGQRVDTLAGQVQNAGDINAAKEKLDQVLPKVETLESKTAGLESWSEFKTDYDVKVKDIALATERAKRAEEALRGMGEVSPDVYLDWLMGLQYVREGKANYGAIAWHDSPTTYLSGTAYYKIEPYFASTAVYYALEAAPERTGKLALRWLNWWMMNMNPTTGSTLIHYTDGENVVTRLEGADPVVQPDNEDATDSNIAMFFLALGRYMSLFGTKGLYADWKSAVATAYDALSNPNLKHTDHLTWAKSTYPIKFLMDNVEVWAGLGAVINIFEVAGDSQRKSSAVEWQPQLQTAIYDHFWDDGEKTWKPSMDGGNQAPIANLDKVYPDLMCQGWPELFDYQYRETEVPRFYEKVADWASGPINKETNATDAQIAYLHASQGYIGDARRWLLNIPIKRLQENSFTWPFTCADAAITAAVARKALKSEMVYFLRRIEKLEKSVNDLNSRFLT